MALGYARLAGAAPAGFALADPKVVKRRRLPGGLVADAIATDAAGSAKGDRAREQGAERLAPEPDVTSIEEMGSFFRYSFVWTLPDGSGLSIGQVIAIANDATTAGKLAKKSPVLMRMGKDAMFRQQDMTFADALEYLHHNLTLAFSTEDIQEGVKAFFEKREPVWAGR